MEAFALYDPQNAAIQWNQHYTMVKGVGGKRLATHRKETFRQENGIV